MISDITRIDDIQKTSSSVGGKSMRYYGFKLGTNVEEIKENAKIELRHYGYDNVLESINSYMYQNMKNDRTFLVYRGRR